MFLNRKLGSFEQTWVMMDEFVPVLFVGVLHLTNGPAAKVLRQALSLMQRRHPLLRVAIANRGGNRHFVGSGNPPEIPLKVLKRTGTDQWREVAERELNTAVDTSRPPLCRCTYLQGSADSEFIFTFHHTIIDSRAGMTFVDELLSLCADIETGVRFDDTRPVLKPLPAMEDLYPPRFKGWHRYLPLATFIARQMAKEVVYRLKLKGRQQISKNSDARCRIMSVKLDCEVTSALVRQARSHRLSLNNILHAAMAAGVARHRYRDQSVPMRGIAFADMRPYLVPSPSAADLGVYISMLPYTINAGRGETIWAQAGEIGRQIYRAIKYNDKFIAPLFSKHLLRTLISRRSMRLGMIALSYAGPVRLGETYGNIGLKGLSGFISNNVLGPELAAFGALIHGCLSLDFLYLDSDMDAREAAQIVTCIHDILLSLCTQPGQEKA